MFSVDRNTVNYTAMLLAFCKDEDPREGLGKAFTLATGNKICTDPAEGEKYVQELAKRRARHLSLTHLRKEAIEVNDETPKKLVPRYLRTCASLRFHRSVARFR
ncbi:uncharacterized protein LOC105181782 [Harpegnathos saltator]|uniref:uncharacterized protein LOC105181782 n=1 Tax=Harpegnathos saltator TaxID=610380 RepID=UPI000DBED5A9|nr:uncharacterized protein LOC105181782 [Harpegnathos saltator]